MVLWCDRFVNLEGSHPQKPLGGIKSECDYEDVWSITPTTSTMKTGSHQHPRTPRHRKSRIETSQMGRVEEHMHYHMGC